MQKENIFFSNTTHVKIGNKRNTGFSEQFVNTYFKLMCQCSERQNQNKTNKRAALFDNCKVVLKLLKTNKSCHSIYRRTNEWRNVLVTDERSGTSLSY